MKRKMIRHYFVEASVMLLLASCSHYSFYQRSNPHLQTVMIPEFKNNSERYELSEVVTDNLTRYFIEDRRLKVKPSDADMEVIGTIISYDESVYSYTMSEEPLEWQITIQFSIEVIDRVKDKNLWKADNLVLTALYADPNAPADTSSETTNLSEEEAWEEVSYALADMILANSLEQW
ncbi:MAG: LPS assembly lipoprotein LptE [Candidatus Cloacimonadia bacterium]